MEPDPSNQVSIARQRELNGFKNWEIVVAAVSNRTGYSLFHRSVDGDSQAHLLLDSNDSCEDSLLKVEATTLDMLCNRFRPPNLVKVDIEGAEVDALQGAPRLLDSVRPKLLIETHGNARRRAVVDVLVAANYQIQTLDERDGIGHILALPR